VQCIELKEAKARGVGVGDYVKKERIKRKPTIWVAVSVTQDIHPQNKTKIQDIRGDVPPFFFFNSASFSGIFLEEVKLSF
jgi:hypothetical protein